MPGDITYSNFVITECTSGNIVDERNGNSQCIVEMSGDTLLIKQLALMALSPNLDLIQMPWLTTKFFYLNNNLSSTTTFNSEIHYTRKQIARAFKNLDTTQWLQQQLTEEKQARKMMRFASQMMIADISGDKKAGYYFQLLKQKFKPSGVYAVWYKEMEDIISAAQKRQTITVAD